MNSLLYSIILELSAINTVTLTTSTGHQAHALFLHLIQQIDPALATRLHDEPDYRPFTVSPLMGAQECNGEMVLQAGHLYHLRLTFLDGGSLWQCLNTHMLGTAATTTLQIGPAAFCLHRLLSTSSSDPTGWAEWTTWQQLATTPACRTITMHLASPTAFSMGNRQFALFPEPLLLWESLMRTWNRYAPTALQIEKSSFREAISQSVSVQDYILQTMTLRFPGYIQRGCVGSCTYQIKATGNDAARLSALAAFARYAGIGYKTTMGMGQARAEWLRVYEQDGIDARSSGVASLSRASRSEK
jgi:CRISPR-associated endoribonuclease Cas6